MSDLILERIKKEIENFSDNNIDVKKKGFIKAVGDGVVEVSGLEDVMISEIIKIENSANESLESKINNDGAGDIYALVLNIEADSVKAIILGSEVGVYEGQEVVGTGNLLSVNASESLLGRTVNALGEVIDGKGSIKDGKRIPIERPSYGVMDRSPVNEPLQTGIKAIDSMIPIGRGQRELIIGDRGTGKTTIAIDTILNQKNESKEKRPICIYVAIGQKDSKTAKIIADMEEKGAMEYTIVVSAGASEPAVMQYLAPFTGVSIAEYFMEQGKDVLVVYDDLSKHAVAYRQISLLLRRPPGREAYPGDVFYLHSRLLERAAKVNDSLGGGSISALPIIETQEGDVSAYVPTNVISITDGQIFLDSNLFNKGIKPAIDVGLSVSRVGSSAQTKAMKKVSGPVKLQLAQFRELEAFMQFSSDLDPKTKEKMDLSAKVVEALKQKNNSPLPFEQQTVSLFFATGKDFVKNIPTNKIAEVEEKLLTALQAQQPEILSEIKETKVLGDEVKEKLKEFILDFVSEFEQK